VHIERLIHTSTRFTNQTNPLLSATGSTCLTLSYFTCLRWWYSASSSHDVKMQPGTQGIRELLLLHLLTARLFTSTTYRICILLLHRLLHDGGRLLFTKNTHNGFRQMFEGLSIVSFSLVQVFFVASALWIFRFQDLQQ